MIDIKLFVGKKQIPSLAHRFFADIESRIYNEKDEMVSLDDFNEITGLEIKDPLVLSGVTYHDFNWPPTYWKYLRVLRSFNDISTPESFLLGVDAPVESLEYPGFFMIPYYSNYVLSPDGVLLRRFGNLKIQASRGVLGYYTYRMTDDSGKAQNQLRHRILCMAFKPYTADLERMDVNHIDGIPGNDSLSNLEWCTRSRNIEHAYENGLRNDNRPVCVRDCNTGVVYFFPSCSAAGKIFKVTETTISNRAKTNGLKAYGGYQFQFYPAQSEWPEIEEDGKYRVIFPDGKEKLCDGEEAARLVGLTRTSLLRALREGRNQGTNNNKVYRI